MTRRSPRFEDLTETTGIPLSAEGASMMYTRYAYGGQLALGRRVLELGCGAGQGFGLLGARARHMVGGDYSIPLLRMGRRHYGARFPLVQLSAEHLPFRNGSFELVLCFEATYYVPDMNAAFDELARVLARDGVAVFVNANPERPDFIRSPHSVRYHTAAEFQDALQTRGFRVTVEAAFPVSGPAGGPLARGTRVALSLARRALEALHLVPLTLRGRARLKRLVYGEQRIVPAELREGFASVAPRVLAANGPVPDYKVLYVTAVRDR